jgi:hypothetical protein
MSPGLIDKSFLRLFYKKEALSVALVDANKIGPSRH